jgi:hydroxyacyl-ACP dehydratase HTD2-like protein with hotdog domain
MTLSAVQHSELATSTDTPVATMSFEVSELDLFQFSASTFLCHRIHFDREFARSEGHQDLVVHGPLQGAHLNVLASAVAERIGAELGSISFRHHTSAFCGDTLTYAAYREQEEPVEPAEPVILRMTARRSGDGQIVTSGRAELRYRAREA